MPEYIAAFPKLRTVLIGPVPGDPVASGTQLLGALASINPTSCPGDNWKLWIAPGVYDLAGNPLVMKPCVDIEGAGERATTITAAIDCPAATVIGASNTELRMVTIESTLNNNAPTCAFRSDADTMKLSDVTLLSVGTSAIGLSVDNGSSLTLTRVTINASGGWVGIGIDANASSLTWTDVTVVASGGAGDSAVLAHSSRLTIYRSRVTGVPDMAIYTDAPGWARVAHSQLEGGLSPGIACVGNYDANLAPVTCP